MNEHHPTINSNDILAGTEYPDPTTGAPSTSNKETYTSDALGERLTYADRDGNVHTYSYDVLGRQTADAVTTLGTGVDGTVRRIETAFNTQGLPYLYTSFSAASGGSVVNQVEDVYNGLGQLITEYQSHSGVVNTSTTPSVQYAYVEMASGANNSRMTSMTYPNGRVVSYNYASGLDSSISRLTSISDSSGTLESYKYLGLDTIVEMDHPETGVNLTYISQTGSTGDAGDKYVGLDRFGRVVDQNWYDTATSSSTDDFQYGYDRDSNLLYMNNTVSTGNSELYGYNGLSELTSFERGTLNSGKTGITGTPSVNETWSLDALGNWLSVTVNGTTQTRTANSDNQISSISSLTTPGYDGNGNTTTDQNGNTFVYDAWNRLVEVKSGSTVLETDSYDALGRKIVVNTGTARDVYFSQYWQDIEEDVSGTPQDQYVWGTVYVDELVERDRDADGNPANGLEEKLFAQQDANWDITALVNTSGTVEERYLYDPYGAATILTGSWGSRGTSSYAWNYLHQGGQFDAVSGLYDFRSRDYSPALGRWFQSGAAFNGADSANSYEYQSSDPENNLDPMGTSSIDLPVKGGSIQIGKDDGPEGGIEITHTGGGNFQVRQWMQIEVNALYACPSTTGEDCINEVKKEVPPGIKLPFNQGVTGPGHSHGTHITANPISPNPAEDNDGGDWQPPNAYKTLEDGTIIWHDNPNLVLNITEAALNEAEKLTPPTNSKGQSCTFVGVLITQRFVTQVFIDGKPQWTIPWDSSTSAPPSNRPTFTKPTKPTTTIGEPSQGKIPPEDVLRPKPMLD